MDNIDITSSGNYYYNILEYYREEIRSLYNRCLFLLSVNVAVAVAPIYIITSLLSGDNVTVWVLLFCTGLLLLMITAHLFIRALQPREEQRIRTPDKEKIGSNYTDNPNIKREYLKLLADLCDQVADVYDKKIKFYQCGSLLFQISVIWNVVTFVVYQLVGG